MKTMIAVLMALVSVSAAFGGSFTNVVTPTETVLLPGAQWRSTVLPQWTTGTVYAVGARVSFDGTAATPAMAVRAGTSSTNVPAWRGDADTLDGTVVWRSVLRGLRKNLVVANTAASAIRIDFWPSVGGGIPIAAGATWEPDPDSCPQGTIYVRIPTAATGTVSVVADW